MEKAELSVSRMTETTVFNTELLGNKLAALICEMIDLDIDHDVLSVVIRADGYPAEGDDMVFSMAYADTQSIAINLKRCWDNACEVAAGGEVSMSLLHVYWTNVLIAVGHEIDHINVARQDRDGYEALRSTPEGYKALEEAANIHAKYLLLQLALKYDVEMPAPADLGWAGVQWMALNTGEEKGEEWVENARLMLETGVVYDDGEHEILTYREIIKRKYDAEGKYEWEQPTTSVNMTATVDGEKVEIQAEPVAQPEVAPAEKEVVIEQQPQQMSLFVGAVADGEYDDSPEEMPEDAAEAVLSGENADTVVTGHLYEAAEAATATAPLAAAGPALAPSVELPAPVAAIQAQYAAHTAAANAPKETPTTYPPNNLSPETMGAVMENVWKTLYHHVFTKCGWQQDPQTGHFFFASPANVLEPVRIDHIIKYFGAENFIMEYDTEGAPGSPVAETTANGTVRGHLSKAIGLPMYTLYLNIGGRRVKRSLLPQNPQKRNASNAYSNPAIEAQGGNCIAWISRGEAPFNASFKEKYVAKIRNNGYELIA
jgi:hypothetical protein